MLVRPRHFGPGACDLHGGGGSVEIGHATDPASPRHVGGQHDGAVAGAATRNQRP